MILVAGFVWVGYGLAAFVGCFMLVLWFVLHGCLKCCCDSWFVRLLDHLVCLLLHGLLLMLFACAV